MTNNTSHIMNRYGKWITNKQKERLRKLYKGYRQSTAGDMRSQYLNARKGMYGVRTTASAYGLGEGYVARKKAQMDSSLAEAGRQYAAQADAAFENNAVRPAANATIQAENERKQREYEEKLRKAREKAAKQAKAQADYEKALEEYNRNKGKTDKENAKRLAEYKKAMAKYRKDLKNAKQRGERLDRLPQRQVLHGGQPLPKGLSLSADLHQYEGASSTPKPLKPLPKGKGKGKGKGRGGVLSDQMYEYESGTGHQPIATSHQGLNNRPVAPKYVDKKKAKKTAQQAVTGTISEPKLSVIPGVPIPVAPEMEKDIVAKVEATKPEDIPSLKNDYLNEIADFDKSMEQIQFEVESLLRLQNIAGEFQARVADAKDTRKSPEQRRLAAQEARQLAHDYNATKLNTTQGSLKQMVANVQNAIATANAKYDSLQMNRAVLQRLGVNYDEEEINFHLNRIRNGQPIYEDYANKQMLQVRDFTSGGESSKELKQHLKAIDKYNRNRGWGLQSWEIPADEAAWLEANGYGWINETPELLNIEMAGDDTLPFSDNVARYLNGVSASTNEYNREKNATVKMAKLRKMNPSDVKRAADEGDKITGLTKGLAYGRLLANNKTNVADVLTSVVGKDKGSVFVSSLLKKLDLPKGYITKNTYGVMTDADVAFINYCYGTGDEQAGKDYLWMLTEWGNQMAGASRAEAIAGKNAPDWIKYVREYAWQLAYGYGTFATQIKDAFNNRAYPVSEAGATSSAITQNMVKRGMRQDIAENTNSAAVAVGNNLAAMTVGAGAGKVIDSIGSLVGEATGKAAAFIGSRAPSALLGMSAAGGAKQQALRDGYDAKTANAYGLAIGLSESVLQEYAGGIVGFGEGGMFTKALSKTVSKIPSGALRTVVNAGLDIASETGQELFGDVINNVADSLILGKDTKLFEGFDESGKWKQTVMSTALSTFFLNTLTGGHIRQAKQDTYINNIAKAANMSRADTTFLLETSEALKNGEKVSEADAQKYNELTAKLMASMPDNVVKAIDEGKMAVADWVTSNEGVVQGKLTGKLTKDERTATQTEAVDHTETLKGKTDEQRRDYLLNAAPTGKVGSAYYTTTNGKAIEFKNLNTTQKANYVLAQKCAKAFEGSVDVVIHDTLPLSNGAMVGSDGKLHIALDVTDNKGRESIAYWTLAHEAGHALKIADGKAWNEMFGILTDYAKNYKDRDGKNLYDALVDSITNQYKYDSNSDAFNDEMFSLIAERMVGSEGEQWAATLGDNTIFDAIAADRNVSAKAKKGFLGKLKTSVEKLSRQFRDGGFAKERKRLAKIREQLTEAYKRINEAPSIRDAAADRFVATRQQIRNSENLVKDMTLPSLAINDRETAFTDLIFSGKKDIETRKYPLPESIKGKWIPVVRTGKGTNSVVGYVKFSGDKMYTAENFADDYDRHRVKSGSNYDIADTKYGWIIEDYQKLDEPIEVGSRGFKQGNYVFRDLNGIIDDPNNNTRFQNRATDTEYLSLAEKYRDGTASAEDINALNKAVEEAARKAGYDSPKLYHGTMGAGSFTVFDLTRSQGAIFLTPDVKTASTYSDTEDLVEIGQKKNNNLRSLKGEKLLAMAKAQNIVPGNYEFFTSQDKLAAEQRVKAIINDGIKEAASIISDARLSAKQSEYAKGLIGAARSHNFSAWHKLDDEIAANDNDYDALYDVLYVMRDSVDMAELLSRIATSSEDLFGRRDVINEEVKNARWVRFPDTGTSLRERLKQRSDFRRGNLAFYGITGNKLTINAHGKAWNSLNIPKELNTSNSVDGNATTRDIVSAAFKAGYDSVVFEDVIDYGGIDESPDGSTTVYAFKAPSQIKSADPVTYDDNGDIIPLSERFNEEDEDIRYQLRPTNKSDSEYLSLAEKYRDGTADAMEQYKLEKAVEKAAHEAGYNSPLLYHGTNAFGFTRIDNTAPGADGYSFWASNKETTSATYTKFGERREISHELDYDDEERILEQKSEEIDDAIDTFRGLIDRYFSEWYFGQQDNSMIREAVDKASPEAGNGDGVYDALVDMVGDAYYGYGEEFSEEYEDFADWQYNSPEWEEIEQAIVDIEGLKRAYAEIEREGVTGGIYELYANTDNFFEFDGKGAVWNNLRPAELPARDRPYRTRDVADWARANGYDGVLFKNIRDNGQYGRTEPSDVYAFFNPTAQVKSADPVTYDNNGDIIPLSERFNEGDEDIRYQQRDFRIDFNVPQLDTKALHEAVKGGEGTVENRFEVKYEKTDSGFAVHITDKDSGKTYDRAETVTEGNAKAEAERAAAAVIRNIKRGKPDSKSKSTAGIYIEKGEIPARDVNIPVSVKEGMRTSKLARTIAEASGMTEESVDELMDRVYDGFMSYKPDVNQESMDKALAKVEDDMAGAVTEWNEIVNKGKILSPDDVALGSALMVSASQSGNINEAMEIAAQLQDLATTGGKLVQSFRMIKRLGAAGAFYYINRQVAKINAELKKAAKGYNIKVNKALVEKLFSKEVQSDYHKIREVTEEIRKDLGHQLKPTLKDWLTAWRYTAMLGNLRTLDRNLLGNAGFMPIVMMKNVVNVGLQGAAKVLSGGKFQKTARLFASKQYTDFAKWDWNDQVKYDIKGNKYNDEANEIKQYMRYDTGAKGVLKIPAKVFNAWRSATTHAMEDERLLGDMAFKKAHYDYTLATRLQQQKVDTEMLKDVLARSRNGEVFKADSEEARLLDIYNKASEYAQQEANRNTYNDINAFARYISQMSKRAKESNNKVVRAAHYAIEGILPFKNTPANIISRAVEYSPIGMARTIAFDIGRLAKGRISGEQFIENLAKGITGSGLFALGAILAKSGILRGALGYDDDEDKDLKRKGHQSYSIEIFDKSITLDWLAPECIPLFMGVEFFNQMGDMSVDVWNEKGLKALLNVTTGAFEPMLNMSMLQGVNALFEGFKSKDDLAGLSKAFATIGTSYLTQFEPTLFGQFARTLDPYRRSTYIDKNSKLPPFISKFWQTAIKKIPGATDTLLPYVNEWGEKEKTPQWWVRALENFLSPAYINDLTETDVDREISRLFESTAETGAFPDSANKYVNYNGERYDLTQKEYEQYAVMRGETAYALAQEMIGTQWYNGLSDVEKTAAFADAYAYADTIASSAILDGRLGANAPDLETLAKNKNRSWVSKANVFAKTMGTPDALSQFIALRQTMAGMTGGRDARAEYLNGINELSSEAKALLMGMYDTSEGYADGTAFYNKNGKLVIDFANPSEAAPAEQTATSSEDATAPAAVPVPTAAPAAQPTAEATAQPKSDKYTKAAEKWAQYGVTQTQAKSAVEKWEQTGNASEYRAWLSKQNYTGRQKFAMYAQANADTEKKAVDFNKKYGTKFEALWDAYAKYDSNSFHGEDYRAWVEKQTNDYRQRFSLVEFAEPRSNWIEHAEELHKAGVSYKAVWEAARYAKNQSGQGKKDRIIAYAKKLGMTSKQAENIYKWFG